MNDVLAFYVFNTRFKSSASITQKRNIFSTKLVRPSQIVQSVIDSCSAVVQEVCPILRQIYAEHCIVLYPHNNR